MYEYLKTASLVWKSVSNMICTGKEVTKYRLATYIKDIFWFNIIWLELSEFERKSIICTTSNSIHRAGYFRQSMVHLRRWNLRILSPFLLSFNIWNQNVNTNVHQQNWNNYASLRPRSLLYYSALSWLLRGVSGLLAYGNH